MRWAEALCAELAASTGKPFLLTTTAFSLHGLVDHALMRLSTVCGRWEAAERHALAAIELCRRLGARPLLARVQYDRAVCLLRARGLLEQASAIARELGWRELEQRCHSSTAELDAAAPEANSVDDAAGASENARPGVVSGASDGMPSLTLEGEYWALRAGDVSCRVPGSRGMHMLAQLLERPGHEFHVLELAGSAPFADRSDAGEMLDARARDEYRDRLRDLRAEMEEAASHNDLARRDRLASEGDALVSELARGLGLGGRPRRAASVVERARVNVRRRLLLALRHIRVASPTLADRLERGLRTGVHCAYSPERARAAPR